MESKGLPRVTVVIPTLNERLFIGGTLAALHAQDYPAEHIEIIVVDGGSTDGTIGIVDRASRDHPTITWIHNPKGLASAARNLGIGQSNGDYVLFVDAHVELPSASVIREMAAAATQHGALVLGRPQPLNPDGITALQRSIAMVRASPLGHSTESRVFSDEEGWASPFSIGVMYRRDVFERFGLFDESFDAAEDLEFNYRLERAGIRAFISPRFTIRYHPRKSLPALFHQMQRYGIGRARLFRKHPERWRIESLVPLVTTLLFLALLLKAVINPALAMVILGIVVFAGVIVLGKPSKTQKFNFAALALAPFCLLTIHIGLSIGILRGLLGVRPG